MALRRLEGRLEKRRFSMLDIALGIWVAVSLFGMWYLLSSPSAKQQQQQQQGGSVENEGGSGTYALQQSRLSPSLADATAAVSGLRKVRVPLPEAILEKSRELEFGTESQQQKMPPSDVAAAPREISPAVERTAELHDSVGSETAKATATPRHPNEVPFVPTNVEAPSDPAIQGSTWPPFDPRQLARRRQSASASSPLSESHFPPKQPSELCKAKGLHGGTGDPNKKLLDGISVVPDNADGRTLMCLIYTTEKSHDAGPRLVRDTWASRCDGFMVMSTKEDADLPAANVVHEGPEQYNNIWQKVRSIWKYVHYAYASHFDWFIIGGDDLFVIAPNLRAYLLSPEITEAGKDHTVPLFLGRRFQIPNAQLFNSGGAGYVLNRPALELLVRHLDETKCRPHQKVFAEDVNVAHCLKVAGGVEPYDTRDKSWHEEATIADSGKENRERFHPFTPGQHLTWRPPKRRRPNGQSPDWYENYNAPWGIGLGADCCSEYSVSFHYVKPNLMPHMSALLFDCR